MNKKFPTILDLVVYILIFIFSNILVAVTASLCMDLSAAAASDLNNFFYFPIALVTVVLLYLYRRLRLKRVSTLPNIRFGFANSLWVLAGLVVIPAISIVVEPLIDFMNLSTEEYLSRFTDGNKALTMLTVVFVAPVFEEYFFRGIILRDVAHRWGAAAGILLSSLLFGLIHFNLLQAMPAVIMGMFFGLVYTKTNYSLLTVIVIHSINNLISLNMIYLNLSDLKLSKQLTNNPDINTSIVIVSYIIVLLIFIATLRAKNPIIKEKKEPTSLTEGE